MSRTKVVGYLVFAIAVLSLVKDIFDGGGFDLNAHFNEIIAALGGVGLVFLRSGVDKAAGK
jgi:hypothetical protein